jgi:hypothetical protein
MRSTQHVLRTAIGLLIGLGTQAVAQAGDGQSAGRVEVIRAPDGGIQPQAAIDDKGTIHLIYFKGDPFHGDLFYTERESGKDFTPAIRVNSQGGSAVAVGAMRGGQIALGRSGRIHVAWNGSDQAQPKNPLGGLPMLYSRSNDTGAGFEHQRNLMERTTDLDGGGTVTADDQGNVYVAWHGRAKGAADTEVGRRMWVARSHDDGATFTTEAPALARAIGACACCGARALADRRGQVYILYRAAIRGVDRDMFLLASRDQGARFQGTDLHPWPANTCPGSSASLADTRSGVLAAWETKGQVYFATIDPMTLRTSRPIAAPGPASERKNPALASNTVGRTLLVWSEGTGWLRGGSLAWQIFDASGRPTKEQGRVDGGIPVWGLATVVARPDGGFTIIH